MALPNVIMIQLDDLSRGHVELAVQRLTSMQLDKVSAFAELVDRVKHKQISLCASQPANR